MKQTIKEFFDIIEWATGILFFVVIVTAAAIWFFGQTALRQAIPILVWTVIITLSAGAITWLVSFVISQFFGVRQTVAEKKRDYTLARNDSRLSDISIERSELHLKIEAAAGFAQLGQMRQGQIYANKFGESSFASHTKAVASMSDSVPLLTEPLPKLSALLPKAQRILIAGGQNAGKTTICQWIAYYKLQVGRVIVIDSHATPARWPTGCEVIGAGRDYDKIEALLQWMMNEMDKRFKDQAAGIIPERGHEIISVVSDEWTLLPEVIKNVERYTTPLLTETRKAGFDFYLAAHDTTVDALGIRGKGGLRKAFDFAVLCDYDFTTDERHTYVNFMKAGRVSEKDNVEYEPPGPFVIHGQAETVDDSSDVPLLVDDMPTMGIPNPIQTAEEKQAILAFRTISKDDNFSWRKATQAAFGDGKYGQTYNDKLKSILSRYEIDYSEYVSE